jgi:radical SAM superfamily enzyme with C-terminal helix-hairpin-helix motif
MYTGSGLSEAGKKASKKRNKTKQIKLKQKVKMNNDAEMMKKL